MGWWWGTSWRMGWGKRRLLGNLKLGILSSPKTEGGRVLGCFYFQHLFLIINCSACCAFGPLLHLEVVWHHTKGGTGEQTSWNVALVA